MKLQEVQDRHVIELPILYISIFKDICNFLQEKFSILIEMQKIFFFVAVITFISLGVWIFFLQNNESARSLKMKIVSYLIKIEIKQMILIKFREDSARSNQHPVPFGDCLNKFRCWFNFFHKMNMDFKISVFCIFNLKEVELNVSLLLYGFEIGFIL